MFYDILERNNAFLGYKNKRFKQSKTEIFPKEVSPRFCPKMAITPNLFFWQYRPGNYLLRYSTTKQPLFSVIKKRTSKSQKIEIFPKGLTHGFCPKMAIFLTFFLGIIGQENVVYDIQKGKNALVGYKNKKLKEVEKLSFFQTG